MLFRLLIPVIQLKKAEYNTKFGENEKKKKILNHDHDKYTTSQD